jgi:hypothetical protein
MNATQAVKQGWQKVFGAGTGTIKVTTKDECSWSVLNTNTWVTITTPLPAGGTNGTATINYSVTNNPFPVARTGTVTLANQTLTLMQRSSTDGPPFAFQTVERDANGDVRLRLGGAPAGVWRIDSSSNLITWTTVATNLTASATTSSWSGTAIGAAQFFRVRRR